MSRLHWLDTAEYLSFGTAALGTIAATLTQQVVYATAPLTLSIGVSLTNRQRLDRLRQQQSRDSITQLQSTSLAPTNQKLSQLENELEGWKTQIAEKLESGFQTNKESLQSVYLIPTDQKLSQLEDKLKRVEAYLAPTSQRVAHFESELENWKRELTGTLERIFQSNKESLRSADLISTHQKINQLEDKLKKYVEKEALEASYQRIVEEYLQKRLEAYLTPTSQNLTQFKSEFKGWKAQLTETLERIFQSNKESLRSADLIPTNQKISQLEDKLQRYVQKETLEAYLTPTSQKLAHFENNLESWKRELTGTIEKIFQSNKESLRAADLIPTNQKISQLEDKLQKYVEKETLEANYQKIVEEELPKRLEAYLESKVQDKLQGYQKEWETQLIALLNEQLTLIKPYYKYKLVFGRVETRSVLIEALDNVQHRLIIVCPWLSQNAITEVIISRLDNLIARGVKVDIGWGSLRDIEKFQNDNNGTNKTLREKLKCYCKDWKYNALGILEQRESAPGSFLKLKLMGTHEKYLVCDNSFAMLGSHNLLTSMKKDGEREIGIRVSDPHIIKGLIERFESAENLDTRDLDTSNQKGNFLSTPQHPPQVESPTLRSKRHPNV
jgi:hypothetical protein